ncbi:Zinc finger protein 649 like protein [Argiope bruennichi]|uniref:Zinc finger protein 649 like protein n=1 Tax=Argiope bruennichi TaxID=94029 RepID=A0A8T0FZJ6_ARGBR|nr:Zinc finger protein 649 like protein [Argiope bruennichi]
MGPKRNVKVNKRGRPPMKQVPSQKVVFAKKSQVKKQEVKKRGRKPKQAVVSKNENSKPISLEDIVKVGNVSTCDICQGVWFSKELFEKHLLTCRLPEQVISSGKGSTSATDSLVTSKSKKRNNDQGIEDDVAAITNDITEIYASPLKKRKKFENENENDNVKNSGKKKAQTESVIQTATPRSGRSRRSQVQEKINQENALDSITVHSSTDIEIDNQDKSSEGQSTVSDTIASIVDEVNLINKIKAPQRGRRGRRPKQKVNGEIKKGNSQSLETQTRSNEDVNEVKAVVVKSGRGRKAQQKEQIIIPDAIEDHDAPDENIDEESENISSGNEQRNEASKSTVSSSNENSVPCEKQVDSQDSNDLTFSENNIDPGVTTNSTNTNEHIPFSQNTVFLTPLQPVKEEGPLEEVDKEEKDALLTVIFGESTNGDNDNADDPPPSTSKTSQKASSSTNVSKDSNGITFNCAVCQRSFTRKYHLDRHLKISKCSGLPLPSFPCELCNRVYTRKDNLREHLRSHTGEVHRRKNHKCQYCDKAFHGQSLLAIHVRKHTGERPFACDFCPKRFPSTGALTKHRMTHTGEKPYSCNECGRRFTLKGTLSRHLRTHTGIRPHTCNFCGKKFIQIGGLNAHMFYHTGENGFKCDDCGKVFNRKARLQMHQLYVHIKLKPFVCEHCSKPFTRKEDLNRHSVLHSGEKPFKCPTCDRRFSVKPSLKLHLLTHTKEEPRSCHECGRAFIRKDCLLRHMRKRHRDVFDKLLFDEKDEKDASLVNTRVLSEKDLTENIRELLYLLIDEPTLVGFGWPDKPVDEVLELVIQRCGHTPVNREHYVYMDRLRENAKLLFTVVIDDNAVKTLLNNQTVDEVILHVLRLAKT